MTEFEMQILVRANSELFKEWVLEGQTTGYNTFKWNRQSAEICFICTGKKPKSPERHWEIHPDWYEVYSWCKNYFGVKEDENT